MNTHKKDKHFIHKPEYPGGTRALWTFIRGNLRYPKEALDNQISGIVRLRYTIDNKGIVISTQILHSLGYGCDEEAIRVIRMLRYYVPKHRKLRVKFYKTINVKFMPPKKKTIEVTLSKNESEPNEEPKENEKPGYEYTITIH